ncbi:hypothetical protein CBS101457_006556 [Exobasidium rhododendri]|nr:hypothetical protein CBS101457_006556 [Exobasidium rhododendri]
MPASLDRINTGDPFRANGIDAKKLLDNGTHCDEKRNVQSTAPAGFTLSSSSARSSFASTSSQPVLPPDSLHVRQTASAGRGVFASVPLTAGTLLDVSHILLFPAKEYHDHGRHTQLDEYTYVWSKGIEGNTMALALGIGSLFNHSYTTPNVSYTLDRATGTIRYTLMRDVMPEEELCISYGTGRMWWEEEAQSKEDESLLSEGDDANNKIEEELLMLGQLGLVHDEQETRHSKRREDRHRYESSFTPTPPIATPPPIIAPKLIGPEAAPLWRITAAVDPNTTSLELMTVWAVEIDPRKSSNFMQFSRSVSRRLRAAEEGGDGQEHIPRIPERSKEDVDEEEDLDDDDDDDEEEEEEEDDGEDEDESMKHLRLFHRTKNVQGLSALVCRVQDVPSMDKVVSLLKSADVVYDGTEPAPYQVLVPKFPAPSRERLPEWKAFWPVAVQHGKSAPDFSSRSTSSSSLLSNKAVTAYPMSNTSGAVDRAADARLWTKEITQWAVDNFRKCIELAKKAKEQGELPIGVHVTPAFSDLETNRLVGPDGHPWIEVDAWDTRRSERNPIKHAVTNAIRDVAKLRSDRDRERLVLLGAKVAASNRDSQADPHANRLTAAAKAADELGSGRVTNSGQDYLLNNLILFTTHEPCLLCCMSLVHSRVRAIYFIQPSPGAGGCCGSDLKEELRCTFAQDGGPFAVQEQAGLNHHFDVWKWVGSPIDLGEEELNELLDVHHLDA